MYLFIYIYFIIFVLTAPLNQSQISFILFYLFLYILYFIIFAPPDQSEIRCILFYFTLIYFIIKNVFVYFITLYILLNFISLFYFYIKSCCHDQIRFCRLKSLLYIYKTICNRRTVGYWASECIYQCSVGNNKPGFFYLKACLTWRWDYCILHHLFEELCGTGVYLAAEEEQDWSCVCFVTVSLSPLKTLLSDI